MSTYSTREALRARFTALYTDLYKGSGSTVSRIANGLWLLRQLAPGDLVVANRGESEVLGVGAVVDPVLGWLEDAAEYQNIVHVSWDTWQARKIKPITAWRNTIADVPPALAAELQPGRPGPALTAQDFEVLRRH